MGIFFHLVSQDICRVFQIDEDWSKKNDQAAKMNSNYDGG